MAGAHRLARLTSEFAPAAAECVAESFASTSSRDPFTWLFNLKKHHWFRMSYMFINRAAEDRRAKSVIAINPDGRTVDAVMVNEDFKLMPPDEYEHLPSDWRPVRAAFRELHTRFKANHPHPVEEGSVMHCLYFTCVRPEVRGRGLMKDMWNETLLAAQEFNYKHIVAEASTREVRDVLHERLGFREIASVDYETWKFEGYPLFRELRQRDPEQYENLWLGMRRIVSDLYV